MKPKDKNGIPWVRARVEAVAADLEAHGCGIYAQTLRSLIPHLFRNRRPFPPRKGQR